MQIDYTGIDKGMVFGLIWYLRRYTFCLRSLKEGEVFTNILLPINVFFIGFDSSAVDHHFRRDDNQNAGFVATIGLLVLIRILSGLE